MRVLLLAVAATLVLASPAAAAPTWLPATNLTGESPDQPTSAIATAADGTTKRDEFDPIVTALKYGSRVPVFHAKDGVRAATPPKGFEGGWVWTTFNSGDMPLEELFQKVMAKRSAADAPYLNIEQDNAVAGEGQGLAEPFSDPAKSLRDARTDLIGLVAMRA